MPEGSIPPSCGDTSGQELRLSTASISSNDSGPSATSSRSSEQRPPSLISTLSSGSGVSRDLAPSPSSLGEPTPDVNPVPVEDGDEEMPCPQSENRKQSPGQQQNSIMVPNHQLTYLDRVVTEIVETERTYVRDLRMIVEDYLAYIIEHSGLLIRPEQVCFLFGNIEDIYEFNSELLQDMDQCHKDPVAIAHCFVTKSEYFEVYTQYCTNYPNSVATLTECMRNQSLAKFFRERQAQLKCSLPLGSFLLKPVQRILKYHLLLQEIAKHFDPQEEEGLEVVQEAIWTMTGVAWYINDMKRKHEHSIRLQEVQSLLLNWKGPDLTTFGELVLEGTFKVHRAKTERTLFLFDRMLLITKHRGEHYVYKAHISCSTLMLIESAKDSLSFSVTHYKHPKQPHTVQAKTVEEKKLWAHHIKRIILENHQAIIPQKAKDAILEMDQMPVSFSVPLFTDTNRYHYSPDRLKKEFRRKNRGFRRSEPNRPTPTSQAKVPLKADISYSSPEGPVRDQSGDEESGRIQDLLKDLVQIQEEQVEDPHQIEEQDIDEVLLEDHQVEDFTSSVLASISFWSLRVQIFESSLVTQREGGIISRLDSQHLEEKEEDDKGRSEQESGQVQKTTSESEPTENSEPKSSPKPDVPVTSTSPPECEEMELEENTESRDEEPSAVSDPEPKTQSSEEYSEEDDEEKEPEPSRILPSSVLDRSSAIAEHFSSSRGGVDLDRAQSLSPRSPGWTGRSYRLSTKREDQTSGLDCICSDLSEAFSTAESAVVSPRDDKLSDVNNGLCQRRDSILSKQDKLLINKIKSYYENAENQDASFKLQRRESLTYIPVGLVRSSISRLNSIPKDEPVFTTLQQASIKTTPALTEDATVSGGVLDFSSSTQTDNHPKNNTEDLMFSCQENPPLDEEFRPSSEMIKIWQTMEQEIIGTQRLDTPRIVRGPDLPLSDSNKIPKKTCDPIKEVSDIKSTTKESKSSGVEESSEVLREPVSQVDQLKVAGGSRPEEVSNDKDLDLRMSKVQHLARKYSQKIKTTKSLVRPRKMVLPCVMEEAESSGKQNPSLMHQISVPPSSPEGRASPPILEPSGQTCPRGLLSPPPTKEDFTWPDVRQLRSKYWEHQRPVEQMLERGMRRHSSCLCGPLRSSGDQKEAEKQIQRASSLDLQRCQDQGVKNSYGGFFIAAEALLTEDPDHKIIVMEKIPETESESTEVDIKSEDQEKDNGGYVEIHSPTSREKISIMAVIDRCRIYQDSDEYKLRTNPESVRPQEPDKTAGSPKTWENNETSEKVPEDEQSTDEGPQSIVKNLTEKFQSLR
ncbi:pleckstrin homology domain-containing family G member 3-like isoform X2 [Cynoglossus semilaevis]|uniref:pleckstrin homology domain-containing family G member 3-like isoform X2 n=1 Tax=Cynoglossus semilaevis TaxID=244447 RepID=UPI0007DC8EA8|nr:pleckstrin homology domain-containing family G member 3-like isoform X2 [Cynoglossus semilaevis]